jgi:hypothetical protein
MLNQIRALDFTCLSHPHLPLGSILTAWLSKLKPSKSKGSRMRGLKTERRPLGLHQTSDLSEVEMNKLSFLEYPLPFEPRILVLKAIQQ